MTRSELRQIMADAARFRWLIERGVAWRGCYVEGWQPGEWLYEHDNARAVVDNAMQGAAMSLAAILRNFERGVQDGLVAAREKAHDPS